MEASYPVRVPVPTLSRGEARWALLRAQGLGGPRLRGTSAVLERLGAIQIDTISVLARSHLLTVYARTGAVAPGAVDAALWPTAPPRSFEYWSHAACVLPIVRWPEFAFRRRARRERGRRWHHLADHERSVATVLDRLADGPASAAELGGAQRGGPWWDWTEEKIAVEWLLDIGEVVCVRRVGFRRIYDLAARAIPADLYGLEYDDATCRTRLVTEAVRALGVANVGEIARHHQMTLAEVRGVLGDAPLEEVAVSGDPRPYYALPGTLDDLTRPVRRGPVLLSPFDSVLWDRERTEERFGFTHRIEAYTPAAKRIHGYYPMPVLADGALVGRVDPKRDGTRLIIRRAGFAPWALEAVAEAIAEAATWIGATDVTVEETDPRELVGPVTAAVRDALARR